MGLAQTVLSKIEETGWLEELPPECKGDLIQGIVECGDDISLDDMLQLLSSAYIVDECIEEDGDYVQVIKTLVRSTNGIFSPSLIEDFFDFDEEQVQLSLKVGDRSFSQTLSYPDDNVQPELFLFLNEVLMELSIQQRFFPFVIPESPGTNVFFISDTVLKRAIALELIPEEFLWFEI